jgi:hypothetical protein
MGQAEKGRARRRRKFDRPVVRVDVRECAWECRPLSVCVLMNRMVCRRIRESPISLLILSLVPYRTSIPLCRISFSRSISRRTIPLTARCYNCCARNICEEAISTQTCSLSCSLFSLSHTQTQTHIHIYTYALLPELALQNKEERNARSLSHAYCEAIRSSLYDWTSDGQKTAAAANVNIPLTLTASIAWAIRSQTPHHRRCRRRRRRRCLRHLLPSSTSRTDRALATGEGKGKVLVYQSA